MAGIKKKLFIILTILLHISCQEEWKELEGSWILVKNEAKPNAGFIPVLRGQLYHFDKKEFYISNLLSEEELKEEYFIEDNFIKTDSVILGKITHLSKDSLIVESDTNSYDKHFRSLEDVKFSKLEKQEIYNQLISSVWKTEDVYLEHDYKFYFNDKNWGGRYKKNAWVKHLTYEEKGKEYKSLSAYEWWTLKDFKDKLIISFSGQGQSETSHFQITKVSEEKIEGQFLNWYEKDWKESEIIKCLSIQQSEVESMKKLITGNWETKELIKPTKKEIAFLRDSTDMSGIGKAIHENRTSISDLEKRNLKLQFKKNGEYKILAGSTIIRKGEHWGITKDGTYLYLDSESTGENFIELLSCKKNEIKIKKTERISLPRINKAAFSIEFLEIEMKKEIDME